MKNHIHVVLLLVIPTFFLACESSEDVRPEPMLSDQEIAGLNFLFEEEKMARDLYIVARDRYEIMQFINISSSEQKHMNAILTLFDEFNLEQPRELEPGKFIDPVIQGLYDSLVVEMEISMEAALNAAAFVEETDIADIRELRTKTEEEAIINVYDQLECASGNHIRAFTSKLESMEVEYVPSVLTQDEYDAILTTGHQGCG